MTIGLPENSKEVEDRIKLDVAREATDANPYLQNSWLLALVTGFGRRIFDFYSDLKRSEKNTFPDTAVGERAEQWGTIYGRTRIPATQATGNVVATGTAGTLIPQSTIMTANQNDYASTIDATIIANNVSVTGITRSGNTATATTVSAHNLASNVSVIIAGANQSEYNLVNAPVTVTGMNTFTYTVAGSPATPATGTITAAYDSALVPVISSAFGATLNLSLDVPVTLQSPIAGADDVLNVDYAEVGGGTDLENDALLKARYLDKIQNPVAHFSANDIVSKAKEVAGVTRVFVDEAGKILATGQSIAITRNGQIATATKTAHGLETHQSITVTGATQTEYNVIDARILVIDANTFAYTVIDSPATPATGGPVYQSSVVLGSAVVSFMRDNDTGSGIPSASEVLTVKDKLAEIRPTNTSEQNLVVQAPTALAVDFTFTALTPNTLTMQAAILANLQQFFEEATFTGVTIDEDAYRSAIKATVDTQTGDAVQDFDLSTPTGDVTIGTGVIGVLGVLTI